MRIWWLTCLSLCLASPALAQHSIATDEGFVPHPTCRTSANGLWHSATIWSCAHVPTATDWVQIDHQVTLTQSATFWTLYISPAGGLTGITPGTEIVMSDTAPTDAAQFDTGIIVEGDLTLTGTSKTAWTRTAAASGRAAFTVEACAGWKVGDRLLFGDTREQDVHTPEVRVIQSITPACSVTLETALGHPYTAARDHNRVQERTIPVGNLTRDITIRSANPMGRRGHLMLTGHAAADIRYVSIQDMGRTRIGPLDPVTNHLGRYAFHLHHLMEPGTVSVIGAVVERTAKWGYTVHASNGHTLRDNIAYDTQGWGFGTEDSTEQDNIFDHNLSVLSTGQGSNEPDGMRGVGFWLHGPRNILTGNVAINSRVEGFALYDTITPHRALNVFRDNEAIANGEGLATWSIGSATERSTIGHLIEWHNTIQGYYGYGELNIDFVDFYSRSDPNFSQSAGTRRGTYNFFGDYDAVAVTFTRPDIQNKDIGFQMPYGTSSPQAGAGERVTRFLDGTFWNATDIYFSTAQLSSQSSQPMRFDIVRPTHGNPMGTHYAMAYRPEGDLTKRYQMQVQDYQKVAGDSFQVFSTAQAPAQPIPQTGGPVIGCPMAGLTNQQCWNQFQLAIYGALLPSNAVPKARVTGLVVGGNAPPPMNVDCVYTWGAWGPWMPLSATLEQRTRTPIITTPAQGTGLACPMSQTETRAIEPPAPSSATAVLVMTLADGSVYNGTATLTLEMPPVPVDCVVSGWSEWAVSPTNPTQEIRTRTIVTPSSNGGAGCPPLVETRPIAPPPTTGEPANADYSALPICTTTGLSVTTVGGQHWTIEPAPSFKLLADGKWNGLARGFIYALSPTGVLGVVATNGRFYTLTNPADLSWGVAFMPDFGCRYPPSITGAISLQENTTLIDNYGGMWLIACHYNIRKTFCPDFDGTALTEAVIVRNGQRLGSGLSYNGMLVVMGSQATMIEPDNPPWNLCWLNGQMYAHIGIMEVDGKQVVAPPTGPAQYARWNGLARYDWSAITKPAGCP